MLIWWQRGISSHVCLAAWMPATCATVRTSPFLRLPALTSSKVAGASKTRQRATASRTVCSLPPTSTIRALPLSSRCVSSLLPMLSSYASHGAAVVAGRLRHALGFLLHRPHKQRAQCLLVDDGPQGGPDVDLVGAEQAQPQVAVGDQTQAVARGAEMLGDGRDDGDGSGCPRDTAILLRGTVAPWLFGGFQRGQCFQLASQLSGGYQAVVLPQWADGHVLDEADLDWQAPGKVEVWSQVVVDTTQDDDVELDGIEPSVDGRFEAGKGGVQRAETREVGVDGGVQRGQADVDTFQSRSLELAGKLRQQDAVGGEREVLQAGDGQQHAHQIDNCLLYTSPSPRD